MIHSDIINKLTGEEKAFLITLLNHPDYQCGILMDEALLKSYSFKMLAIYIVEAQDIVSDCGLETYKNICDKLKIPVLIRRVEEKNLTISQV